MKRLALLLSLLLTSSMALASGPITYNWTVHNPNNFHLICAASGSACVMDGIAATWTLRSGITVTRIEYQSAGAIYQTLTGNGSQDDGPCPGTPDITITDGTSSRILYVANDAGLYSDSGSVRWKFAAGTKLSVQANFLTSFLNRDLTTGTVVSEGTCTTPPGNFVMSYTIP